MTLQLYLQFFDSSNPDALSRDFLAFVLSHLPLGLSTNEATEVVRHVSGAEKIDDGNALVPLADVYAAMRSVEDPETKVLYQQLRDWATTKLKGKGKTFATAARSATQFDEEWLAPAEFRRALKSIFKTGELQGDDEDRLVLLADKNTSGAVRWRFFIQSVSPGEEAELIGGGDSPTRRDGRGAPSPPPSGMEDTLNQTWRRPKEQNGGTAAPQPPPRTHVSGGKGKTEPVPEEEDDKASGGCLCFGGKKKKYKA